MELGNLVNSLTTDESRLTMNLTRRSISSMKAAVCFLRNIAFNQNLDSWLSAATENEVAAEMTVSRQCSFCGSTLLRRRSNEKENHERGSASRVAGGTYRTRVADVLTSVPDCDGGLRQRYPSILSANKGHREGSARSVREYPHVAFDQRDVGSITKGALHLEQRGIFHNWADQQADPEVRRSLHHTFGHYNVNSARLNKADVLHGFASVLNVCFVLE